MPLGSEGKGLTYWTMQDSEAGQCSSLYSDSIGDSLWRLHRLSVAGMNSVAVA